MVYDFGVLENPEFLFAIIHCTDAGQQGPATRNAHYLVPYYGIHDGKEADLHFYDILDTTLTPFLWMRSATRRIRIRPSARSAG